MVVEIVQAEKELLVKVEGNQPLPDWPRVAAWPNVQSALSAFPTLRFREWNPGTLYGSKAAYSDVWVFATA